MRIPQNKIEKCCATAKNEKLNVALQHVFFDAEKKRIAATNGKILAVVPVDDCDNDTTGLLSVDAILSARKNKYNQELSLDGVQKSASGQTWPRPEGNFPSIDQVVPAIAPDRPPDIIINPSLLLRLSQALSESGGSDSEGVAMWFGSGSDKKCSPILVKSNNATSNPSYGVLMPMRPKK